MFQADFFITQSKSKTQITRIVQGKFNCLATVKQVQLYYAQPPDKPTETARKVVNISQMRLAK